MPDLKVTYFDAPVSRGEEIRLALTLAGVDFEDIRLDHAGFVKIKADLPFQSVPVLEIAGEGVLAQTNAILRLIGRLHGLYPDAPLDAARHDAILEAAEDLRGRIAMTMQVKDAGEKAALRARIATEFIPAWGRGIEGLIGPHPFVGGDAPGVADVKLHVIDAWISSGRIDDIPATALDGFGRLKAVAGGVRGHPAVMAWYAPQAVA